jgi:pyruvate/2-oxoglutarate dehydrogenase complex dihydrolipoamide dehydrogenase (E3) component
MRADRAPRVPGAVLEAIAAHGSKLASARGMAGMASKSHSGAEDSQTDILVLGGGAAGMTAALRARELGASVRLIEKGRLGGICYNEGPAPVRTLARAARLMRDVGGWETFGLVGVAPRVDIQAAIANARRTADRSYERKKLPEFLRAHGIDLIDGADTARFVDAHSVAMADGRRCRANTIILATGGHAARLPIPGQELALTYSDLWGLQALPARVTVIGAAATGSQLASILEDFGAKVQIVESAPRIEPRSDEAISTVLRSAFERRGIGVTTDARVECLEKLPGAIRVHFSRHGGPAAFIDTDAVFFAVGWPANVEQLDLKAAGIARRGAYVDVNEYLQTSQEHVYGVGDVNGLSMVVQSATYEGNIAAENAIFGPRRRHAYDVVPVGSFTDPEYAGVGLTESQARARYDCASVVISYDELTRAIADGRTEGFCKLLVDRRDGRLIGGHVLGEYSAEVVQLIASFMASGMSVARIAELQLAYPTFAEAVVLAARRLGRQLGMILGSTPWDDGTERGQGLRGSSAPRSGGQPLADITA